MEYELGTIKIQAELQKPRSPSIETLADIEHSYCELGEKQKEHVYAIFLTRSNEVIGDKLIGLGGNSSVQFDPADIVRTAALVNAGAVILVHNHPSGNPQPTDDDITATKKVYDVLASLGIQLLDHVVISYDSTYSMKQNQAGPFSNEVNK